MQSGTGGFSPSFLGQVGRTLDRELSQPKQNQRRRLKRELILICVSSVFHLWLILFEAFFSRKRPSERRTGFLATDETRMN
jgi:hypothetical protein